MPTLPTRARQDASRARADVTPETLNERLADHGLQEDVLIAWSHIHGYAQLLLEGQFDGFARSEGMDAFVERTLMQTGERLAGLLQNN